MQNRKDISESTRRLFLSRALQAFALTAVSPLLQGGEVNVSSPSGSNREGITQLNADEFRVLEAVADTIIPQGGEFSLGASNIHLAERIDGYLASAEPDIVTGIRGALAYAENNAPQLKGFTKPFSGLSGEQREQALIALRESDALGVAVFSGLRGLCLFYFYTDEASWAHIGYEGTLV